MNGMGQPELLLLSLPKENVLRLKYWPNNESFLLSLFGLIPAGIGTDISEGWEQHYAPCHLPWEHLPSQHPTLLVHPLLPEPAGPWAGTPGIFLPIPWRAHGMVGSCLHPNTALGHCQVPGVAACEASGGCSSLSRASLSHCTQTGAGQTICFPSPLALQHD